jgi:hypothetical protein
MNAMIGSSDLPLWIRLGFVGIFLAIGMLFLRFAKSGTAGCVIDVGEAHGDPMRERLAAAITRREAYERRHVPSSVLNAVLCVSIALGIAFTPMPIALAFMLLFAGSIALSSISWFFARRSDARRAASLTRRSSPVSWMIAVPAIVACAATLVYADALPVMVAIDVVCTLIVLEIARRTLSAPSYVGGDDPEVDRYVDDRLRTWRTAWALGLATAPSFVLTMLGSFGTDAPISTLHLVAAFITVVAYAFGIGSLLKQKWQRKELDRAGIRAAAMHG